MALRQCDKCDEMVDVAKAFCPGCGNAFVEEEKPETTAFQQLDHTVQFGQTVYNQMLEDMGLNIADAPPLNGKRIEVIKPIEKEIIPPSVRPGDGEPQKLSGKLVDKPNTSSRLIWYIFGGVAVLVLLPIAVVSAIMLFLDVWSRWFH